MEELQLKSLLLSSHILDLSTFFNLNSAFQLSNADLSDWSLWLHRPEGC